MSINQKSVRQQILEAIIADFAAVQPPSPLNDPPLPGDWPIKFSAVNLGPLDDNDNRKAFSVGVVPGQERESFKMPFIYVDLALDVEFRVTANAQQGKPGIIGEQVLTVVKRVMANNRSWNGLAIDTVPQGSEIDLRTYADKSVVGVVHSTLQFRYSTKDVRDNEAAYD